MKFKIPASIARQLKHITFKNAKTMLRHLNTLLVSWHNSDKHRRARQANERQKQQRTALQRRHEEHAESCRQGYLAKIALVEAGKGHNTLLGIPA